MVENVWSRLPFVWFILSLPHLLGCPISCVHETITTYIYIIYYYQHGDQHKQVPSKIEQQKATDFKGQKIIMLRSLGLGFGNLTATAENLSPGYEEEKLPEAAEIFVKAASNCCGKLCGRCCCMCCIQTCSRMNDQCAIVLTQLCGAIACLGCFSCCELCCSGKDWRLDLIMTYWLDCSCIFYRDIHTMGDKDYSFFFFLLSFLRPVLASVKYLKGGQKERGGVILKLWILYREWGGHNQFFFFLTSFCMLLLWNVKAKEHNFMIVGRIEKPLEGQQAAIARQCTCNWFKQILCSFYEG